VCYLPATDKRQGKNRLALCEGTDGEGGESFNTARDKMNKGSKRQPHDLSQEEQVQLAVMSVDELKAALPSIQ